MLKGKTVVVGVCGGISAYKTAELVSKLKTLGADVWVAMTKSAQEFVGPLTFRTLSKNPVITDLFSKDLINIPVPHISLAKKADIIVIAPATANIMGKIACGIADDPITTIVLSSKCKKIIAPAMNCEMWENKTVKENAKKLKDSGFIFVGPGSGLLACGDEGIGRMSAPKEILKQILETLEAKRDLEGKKILVTAGGTQENIDPVRFIGNRSSGKMGYAIAEAAAERGGEVILLSGETSLKEPSGIKTIKALSSKEMFDKMMENKKGADIIIMAAAVADYAPGTKETNKIKKSGPTLKISLNRTKDILLELGKNKNGTKLVGFALETENMIKNAKEKLKNKNLDLIVANGPDSFGSDSSKMVIIDKNGKESPLPLLHKKEIANIILDKILK